MRESGTGDRFDPPRATAAEARQNSDSGWVRGLSHDLRNIIQSTRGSLELLQHSTVNASQSARVAAAIHGLDEMTVLAERLEEPQRLEPMNWPRVQRHIRQAVELAVGIRPIRLDIIDPGAVPNIAADPYDVGRIFLNLTWNACEAMADQGTITISARVDFEEPRHTASWLVIDFQDTGCGIPESLLPRIFDLHYTTKTIGRGVGLATVKSLVMRHHGRVDVESTEGKGTIVHLGFPAHAR